MCHEPARYENGEIIPARSFPCERELTNVGAPAGDFTGPSETAPEIDPDLDTSPDSDENGGT